MANSNHSEGHSHVVPIPVYTKVFIQLLVLMVATVAVAKLAESNKALGDMSYLNNFIAMGIAFTKALLVIMIFMGVKFSTKLTKFYAFLGFVWFSLMFLMFMDYYFRKDEMVTGWSEVPASSLSRSRVVPGS